MAEKTEGRRLHFDDYDAEIYDKLRNSHGPFRKMPYIDIFSVALVYGMENGKRTKLKSKGKSIGRVVESVIDNSELRYLMKAVAIDEKDSINVLLNLDEYFTISEEYAKTGLAILYDQVEYNEDFIDDMEMELHDFYLTHEDELKLKEINEDLNE